MKKKNSLILVLASAALFLAGCGGLFPTNSVSESQSPLFSSSSTVVSSETSRQSPIVTVSSGSNHPEDNSSGYSSVLPVARKWNVVWRNYDGSILDSQNVDDGTLPVYSGKTPVREDDPQVTYTFKKWDKDIVPATGDITYNAVFEENDKLKFVLSEDGKSYSVGKTQYTSGQVVIPAEHDGKPVTNIDNAAFANCTSLTSITIPSTIKKIGFQVFYGCNSLVTIEFPYIIKGCFGELFGAQDYEDNSKYVPSTIKTVNINGGSGIPKLAFRGCESISSVTIGSTISYIGEDAFLGLYHLNEVINLSSLNIAKGREDNGTVAKFALSVKKEGSSSIETDENGYQIIEGDDGAVYFIGYSGKESDLVLPAKQSGKNYKIASYAFYDDESIKSVVIPSLVTSIGEKAFFSCTSLTSIIIPSSVRNIGICAFTFCSSLASITIGSSVKTIGNRAFDGCCRLIEVINLSSLKITKGSSDNGKVAYFAISVKNSGQPNPVETDDNGYQFLKLDGVYYLIDYTGKNTDLVLPDKHNGKNYKIASSAFWSVSSIKSVIIPDSVTEIGINAFSMCENLSSITISSSVNYIGDGAFFGCFKLNDFIYNGTIDNWLNVSNNDTLVGFQHIYMNDKDGNKYEVTSVEIPEGTKSIGNYQFSGFKNLTSVSIPSSVTSIGKYAFSNCSSLTSILIPKSITNIGDGACYNCESLKKVYYEGSHDDWKKITIGSNNSALNSQRYYFTSNGINERNMGYWWFYDAQGNIVDKYVW